VRLASAPRLFGRLGPERLLDVTIAAAVFAGSLALLARGGFGFGGAEPGELDWLSGLLVAASTVPLVAWRRAPGTVFVLTASAGVLLGVFDYPIGLPLGPTVALYLFAANRDEQDPWTRQDTVGVVGLFLAYLGGTALGGGGFPGSELFHTGLAWAVAWFAGERTRLRRAHITELKARADRAERDSDRERALAVANERARIARDLHDAAGHAINVIAVRAGAARMRHDPDRSQAALETIETLARKTVAEIDQIVGTLRDRGSANGPVAAPTGLASLETLVARHAATGLDVHVTTTGKPPRQLENAVDQAAYRILQEALTNAARHGAGAARVELAFERSALQLTITNPATGDSATRPNGGHGLIGMRERATLLGGSLQVERANDTFGVRATIPYEGRRP
jgi:signal transduction histidine kinase